MPIDTHSIITMFEGTFPKSVKGCIALINEDGLALYSTSSCGELYQFEGIASTLLKAINDTRKALSNIDPVFGAVTTATFETEEFVSYISELDKTVYIMFRMPKELFFITKQSIEKFIEIQRAITVLQESGQATP